VGQLIVDVPNLKANKAQQNNLKPTFLKEKLLAPHILMHSTVKSASKSVGQVHLYFRRIILR